MITKTCVICGAEFQTTRPNKLSCSPACRKKYVSERDRKRKSYGMRICVVCGKEFYNGGTTRKSCSPQCVQKRKAILEQQYARQAREFDGKTKTILTNWRRAPSDRRHLDKTLAKLKAQGQTYAEAQRAESIKKWARIEI